MMGRDWFYTVSSFIPDQLSAPGPREAANLWPLLTAPALELLGELGISLARPDTHDALDQSALRSPLDDAVVDRSAHSATDKSAEPPKPGNETSALLQALIVVEALFYLQWAFLEWPQLDLDALLSWWGGEVAIKHRRQLRPHGLDRVYFGRAANDRARYRLKQLLQESEIGAAVLRS